MLRRILRSLRFRLKRRQLGLTGRAPEAPPYVRVAGQPVTLAFPPREHQFVLDELGLIFLGDCYGLDALPDDIETVLDVGANIGLFSLAARHRFPHARIHCYEPNPVLRPLLSANVAPANIQPHFEAVGAEDGRATLHTGVTSLRSKSTVDAQGAILQTGFATALERIGGRVDLLKLDCEGAEWALFERRECWPQVRHLTMEYHLFAKPGATLPDLLALLQGLGFSISQVVPDERGAPIGMLRAARVAR